MGRPKGSKNKVTGAIKDMVLNALANKGGVKYLERQADENPVAFMGLVGKVIPLQVNHADDEGNGPPRVIHEIVIRGVRPNADD